MTHEQILATVRMQRLRKHLLGAWRGLLGTFVRAFVRVVSRNKWLTAELDAARGVVVLPPQPISTAKAASLSHTGRRVAVPLLPSFSWKSLPHEVRTRRHTAPDPGAPRPLYSCIVFGAINPFTHSFETNFVEGERWR